MRIVLLLTNISLLLKLLISYKIFSNYYLMIMRELVSYKEIIALSLKVNLKYKEESIIRWIKMDQIEIVGYIAGLLVATALAPQIIKTWKSKSAKDISTLWAIVLMSGLFLWIVYAIIQTIMPLAVFGIVEFCMAFSLLIFKFIYK